MAIYKLGDIAVIKNGTTPSTKDRNLWKKEIPFFGPSDVESQIATRYITKDKNYKRPGTTVISTTATIGNIGFLREESWFNQQMTSIEPNNSFLLDKYIYYYFLKNRNKIKAIKGNGSIFTILPVSTFKLWKLNLPSLEQQQKIIDIIEPNEELFLKYSNTIRIDSYQNTKKDLNNLIDIIEPIENIKNLAIKISNEVIDLIRTIGSLNIFVTGKKIDFWKQSEKYVSSGYYAATSNIGNFDNTIDNFEFFSKTPSRARITLDNDTLYISKLDGEKKILYREEWENTPLIISNGMWGIKAENYKYTLYSFLFSDVFYRFKKLYSTGTTMRGLNDKSLLSIIKNTRLLTVNETSLKKIFSFLSLISKFISKVEYLESYLIKLLIK